MPTIPVSVVIPCRDYGRYLSAAIESVLHQEGFADCAEVIVIDDHSVDSTTLEKLQYWQSADSRVRVLRNTGRLGAASARNLGIAAASGDWIGFLDADDIWLTGGLQARWNVVRTYPEAQWIGADFRHWHEDGSSDIEGFFKTRSVTHPALRDSYASGRVLRLTKPVREFLQMSLGWTSTILARKSLLLNVGGFETRLGNYEDHHLWIRLARVTDFYFLPQVVTLYRQHGQSVSSREGPPASWYIAAVRMLLKDPNFRVHRTPMRKKLASLFEQNMYYHHARGEKKFAVQAAAHALLQQPSCKKHWKNFVSAFVGPQ